jgi:two-component system, OmpR family, sensor histidine kinase KdpD
MAFTPTHSGGGAGSPRRSPSVAFGLVTCVAVVAAETVLCWFLLDHRLADIVMLYLLGVVVVAMRFGYVPSLFAATLSVAAFDFFFTAPYFSFAVDDKRYVVTFVIMLFVAFVISHLTARIKRSASDANERELRTARLYAMSRELSSARSTGEILSVSRRHLREAFASDVAVLVPGDRGELRRTESTEETPLDESVVARANDLFVQFAQAGSGEPISCSVVATGERLVPLAASSGPQGVIVVRPPAPAYFASGARREFLAAFATQIAQALERARLGEEAQRAYLEVQGERLRNALLSSVSHDLRTPLAVVKGAVTALLEEAEDLTVARRRDYLETISSEASRLNRLVRNLLNMTSLQAGALRARREWQPLEEVVGVALNRLEGQLAGRSVEVQISGEAAFVSLDATLIEQVLLNLLENTIKYTPPRSAIEIRARRVDDTVEVEVADRGPGVPPGQEAAIFEKFHRAFQAENVAGMGLGLAICRGIVSVHGGRIWCENRAGGGASFRFTLPNDGSAPSMTALPEAASD